MLYMGNDIGQMTTHTKAAGSGSLDDIFKEIFPDCWISLTNDAPDFFCQFSSYFWLVGKDSRLNTSQ